MLLMITIRHLLFKFNTRSICPYSKWFSIITYKKGKAYCQTIINELQITNLMLGSCSFTCCNLIQLCPTAYHTNSPLQLVRGNPPSISHLRKFGCATYIPISPPQCTSMDPHRKLGIYVGYQSPSIIKYLEPPYRGLIHCPVC